MDAGGWKELDEFLFARATGHYSPKLLFGGCERRGLTAASGYRAITGAWG